jgi:hypothetical protein
MCNIDQSLNALRRFARRSGASVGYANLPDCIGGCLDRDQIVLRVGRAPEQELLTRVHELIHVIAHVASVRASTHRTICEYEAEAVEQLIAQRLGFRAAGIESFTGELLCVPDGLLADSVTRVCSVASTLLAVLAPPGVARDAHAT